MTRCLLFALLLSLPIEASSQVCSIPPSFPDATNTGYVPTGVTLPAANHCNSAPAGWTQGSTDLNISGTYDGCNFNDGGGIGITANNVTLQRSYVYADATNSIYLAPGTTGTVLQDVEDAGPGDAGLNTDGANNIYFEGNGATAIRMNVHGSRNCWTIQAQNITIRDSYCHDFGATNPNNQHWDGIMDDGGSNKDGLVAIHNYIYNNRWNSAVMIDNWSGPKNGAAVSNSLLVINNTTSQNLTVYADGSFSSTDPMTNISYTNNMISWGGYGYAQFRGDLVSPVWSCNVDSASYRTIPTAGSGQNSGVVVPIANPSCSVSGLSLNCTGGIVGPGTATSFAWSGDCGTSTTQNATLTCAAGGVHNITFQVNNGSWSDAWTIPITAGSSSLGAPGQPTLVP